MGKKTWPRRAQPAVTMQRRWLIAGAAAIALGLGLGSLPGGNDQENTVQPTSREEIAPLASYHSDRINRIDAAVDAASIE